jgi:hypothetical protein
MKIISLIFLLFLAGNLKAQSHIWTPEDAKKANFHIDQLPESYSTALPMGISEEVHVKLGEWLGSVISANADPGIGVFLQVVVSKTGSIDYLIFDTGQTKGYNRDSLNHVMKSVFEKKVPQWVMTSKPEKAFKFMTFQSFGKRIVTREMRKADSAVTTIKEAQAFIDTLKIKRIFFNQLELASMPDLVYRFPNTEELNLNGNDLTALNIDFSRIMD